MRRYTNGGRADPTGDDITPNLLVVMKLAVPFYLSIVVCKHMRGDNATSSEVYTAIHERDTGMYS